MLFMNVIIICLIISSLLFETLNRSCKKTIDITYYTSHKKKINIVLLR